MLQAIIASLIASIILTLIGKLVLGSFWWKGLYERIMFLVTNRNFTAIYPYDEVLKKIERFLKKPKPPYDFRVMCFKGKDIQNLLTEKGEGRGLLEEIIVFLEKGGKVKFLLIDPTSRYIEDRSRMLNKDQHVVRNDIKNAILNIRHCFLNKYPTCVEVKLYDQLPVFRINFIGHRLFLGFYSDIKSYNNVFFEMTDESVLYDTIEKLFKNTWENAKIA